MEEKNIIARALELARSGQYRSVNEIRSKLRSENFSAVDGHLHGLGIRNQLRSLIGPVRE